MCDHLAMHKATIHGKTSKSCFLHHPLTRTFADNDDVYLFSIRLIVLKLYDVKCNTVENLHFSSNVRFQFHIRAPFINPPRTTCNCFIFDEYIQT